MCACIVPVCLCVYMYVCECIYMCAHVCIYPCVGIWRSEVDGSWLPPLLPVLLFEIDFLTKPAAHCWAGQGDLLFLMLPHLCCGPQWHSHVWCLCGHWELRLDPHVYKQTVCPMSNLYSSRNQFFFF